MKICWYKGLAVMIIMGSISWICRGERNKIYSRGDQEDAETKAMIETKLGTIELKFFPEVAPAHR